MQIVREKKKKKKRCRWFYVLGAKQPSSLGIISYRCLSYFLERFPTMAPWCLGCVADPGILRGYLGTIYHKLLLLYSLPLAFAIFERDGKGLAGKCPQPDSFCKRKNTAENGFNRLSEDFIRFA
ncbi:uncharacterized protein LY89DRAFT_58471 [Mollisia scopiformis]|uniref:Uncharacterized protein n=1 Tax=Mollisia scopiformis TaxID=149040 RepID=A0A194XCZ6_MOLSC|nr:uncharacterized protein LY89DRAFT_58471 [Mollisia scopiformis]KUJ17627.1 hypothetical protein LY89DRAFT_58471 [Mollisia scopiformis]